MTIKGYLYDHQQLLSQIQHVFSLLAKIKIVGIQNIDLVNEMYDKVLCALTLVQHLLWKFDVDIGKSYLYLLHPNDQTRLLRYFSIGSCWSFTSILNSFISQREF